MGRNVRPRDACLRRAGVRLASHGLVAGHGWSEPEELLDVGQGRQVRQGRELGQRRETRLPRGLLTTLARGEGVRPVGRGPAKVVVAHEAFVPHARASRRGLAATASSAITSGVSFRKSPMSGSGARSGNGANPGRLPNFRSASPRPPSPAPPTRNRPSYPGYRMLRVAGGVTFWLSGEGKSV